jgi:hypothetical protein
MISSAFIIEFNVIIGRKFDVGSEVSMMGGPKSDPTEK